MLYNIVNMTLIKNKYNIQDIKQIFIYFQWAFCPLAGARRLWMGVLPNGRRVTHHHIFVKILIYNAYKFGQS